jgi:cellobiose phosphorylase
VRQGEAKNSWLTGTAAWNFVAISQYILGIRPEHDGLHIRPCMSKEVPEFFVTRKCRGAVYRIRVKNTTGGTSVKLKVDGKAIKGHLVSYASPGQTVDVECEA